MLNKRTIIELGHITYEVRKEKYKYLMLKGYGVYTNIHPAERINHSYYTLWEDGYLIIRPGYAWNGADVIPDRDAVIRSSLVHDIMCQLYRSGLLDSSYISFFNDLFITMSEEDGLNGFLCGAYRKILRLRWRIRG